MIELPQPFRGGPAGKFSVFALEKFGCVQWPLKQGICDMTKSTDGVSSRRRAALVAEKLAAARAELARLEQDCAAAALDDAEGKAGSAARLAAHRSKIENAQLRVSELTRAHTLAAALDRKSDAEGAIALRNAQWVAGKAALAARDVAFRKMAACAAEMAKAHTEFRQATQEFAAAIPSETHLPVLAIGRDGWGGPFLGSCERLIAAELFRNALPDESGHPWPMPWAKPPFEALRNNSTLIPPSTEAFEEAQTHVANEIEGQLRRLNAQSIAAAAKEAA